MAQAPAGKRAPDMQARVSGPGALAKRTDLQGNQPLRVPTGLPYGAAGQMRTLEQTVALPQATPAPAPGAPSPQGPLPANAAPGMPVDPREMLNTISAHPTMNPQAPLAPQGPPTQQSLAFKVDALRYLSSLPFAGPEVQTLLKKAMIEMDNAQHEQMMAPQMPQGAMPPGAVFNG